MKSRNRSQPAGQSPASPIWPEDDPFHEPAKPGGRDLKRRLLRLIVAGAVLIVLMLIGCYIMLNPATYQRYRLVGHWEEVDVYSNVFTTYGSEMDFGAWGDFEKLEYALGGGSFHYEEQGRWSLEEANGNEMTVHVKSRPKSGDPYGPYMYVMHVKFVSPRRIETWTEASMGSYTYERR